MRKNSKKWIAAVMAAAIMTTACSSGGSSPAADSVSAAEKAPTDDGRYMLGEAGDFKFQR